MTASLRAPEASGFPATTVHDPRPRPRPAFESIDGGRARRRDESPISTARTVQTPASSRLFGIRFALKRLIDVVVALVAIIVLSPLFLIVAAMILIYDGKPVFFRQTRIGRNGHRFTMIKFRSMRNTTRRLSMVDPADSFRNGPCLKVKDDPRVFPVGRILRRTSIDELPQLFNVLSGSMSLVGPRPALPSEIVEFPSGFRAREAMPQGMTGLWQLEARDDPDFQRNVDLDLDYVENWTLRRDLVLLVRTPFTVITQALRGSAV